MARTPLTRLTFLALGAAAVVAGIAACGSSAASPAGPTGSPRPSAAALDATKQALDRRAASAPATVTTWGVDPAAGVVVVAVTGPRTADVDRFLAGLDPRTLRVDSGTVPVRPLRLSS